MAIALLALAWAVARAGVSEVVNVGGWPAFARFWTSVVDPETSSEFLRLTYEATLTTAAFAVLGAAGAMVIGLLGSLLMTELVVGSDGLRRMSTAIAAVPRSVHEILIALLLVQVLGFDPIVAVLAIAVPFGAVTAKVFADVFDDADRHGYDALRAGGAGRLARARVRRVPERGPGNHVLRLLPVRVCDPLCGGVGHRRRRWARVPARPQFRVAALRRDLDPDRRTHAPERPDRRPLLGGAASATPWCHRAEGAGSRSRFSPSSS